MFRPWVKPLHFIIKTCISKIANFKNPYFKGFFGNSFKCTFTVLKNYYMKSLLTILFISLCTISLATVRTVSNTPSTIAQFNTIQLAVNASSAGDTVYVHGSPNIYAGFTITNKQLVIIGPGWSPDKNLPFTALVSGCSIIGATSSNTEIQGLTFISTLNLASFHPDNIRFIRNNFGGVDVNINEGSTTYAGYLFEGNLFDNGSANASAGSTYQNFLFQNNYFYENGMVRDGNFNGFFNSINVLFNHNLWYVPSSSTRNVAIGGNNRFLTFANNIFVRRNASSNISSSVYNNNITFYPVGSSNPGAPWGLNGNVDGGGNIDNQDPQMVAQSAVNAGTNGSNQDFTIAAGPANNTGSDGKDIGLLYDVTGSLNFANSRNSRLPRIFSMNITTPTVAAGGNVTISVEARISN